MRNIRASVLLALLLCAVLTAAQTRTVEEAIVGLKSSDLATRTSAASYLWDLSGSDPEKVKAAIAAVTSLVLDRNLNLRYIAMTILKNVGPEARGAVPFLIKALDTFPGGMPALDGPQRYYADARWAAADALGAIGPEAKEAIPALQKTLKDPSENVRDAAAEALKQIQSRPATNE